VEARERYDSIGSPFLHGKRRLFIQIIEFKAENAEELKAYTGEMTKTRISRRAVLFRIQQFCETRVFLQKAKSSSFRARGTDFGPQVDCNL